MFLIFFFKKSINIKYEIFLINFLKINLQLRQIEVFSPNNVLKIHYFYSDEAFPM